MTNIGIIGAGSMGTDIALVLACYGYKVALKDITQIVLDKAKAKMAGEFRMAQMMRPEWKTLKIADVEKNISYVLDNQFFSTADMIIENVTEDWETKKKVYQELAEVCAQDMVYAVNTSCISITKVAALLPRPDKVVGMHFMNPATLKDMVELIRGFHTSDETLEEARIFLKSIKKMSVVAADMPGFIANRLSHLLMNEAAFLVQDRVGTARDIDLLFKKGYGHAMGPLETADLIGLDTVVNSLNVLFENYRDPKFRCCPLLTKMVDAGLTGRKSGEGFYKYND